MLLTEQEIKEIHSFPWERTVDFVRRIESAVFDKLKMQEPEKWTPAGFCDDGEPLYRHPLPPDDVVRDAERFRWLVNNSYDRDGFLQFQVWKHSWEPHSQTGIPIEWKCRVRGPAIDAAIDAAMKELK